MNCSKTFTLEVQVIPEPPTPDCPNWNDIVWSFDPLFSPFFTTSGATFSGSIPGFPFAYAIQAGTLPFNATGECTTNKLSWSWSVAPGGASLAHVVIESDLHGVVLSTFHVAGSAGSAVVTFTTEPGNQIFTIQLILQADGGGPSSLGGTFSNI
jgi:hypothetical protein